MGNEVTGQALRDLGTLRSFIGGTGVLALCDAPCAPFFLLLLLSMHLELGALAIVSALALFTLAVLNEYLSRAPLRDEARSSITDRETAEQALKNAEALRAMGMLPGFLTRWAERNTETLAAQLDAGERGAIVMGLSKFLRLSVQVLILGARRISRAQGRAHLGRHDRGVDHSRPRARSRGAIDRRVEGLRRRRATLTHALRTCSPRRAPRASPCGCRRPRAGSRSSRSCFCRRARPSRSSRARFRPRVRRGAGHHRTLGGGKVDAVPPARGRVGADARPCASRRRGLRNWAPRDLGQHVGYLPQDVELFAGTIKDNIARLAVDPDPTAVVEAAKLAGVHEMILSLARGYDTEIGLDGGLLSGGQRQRIGLARALYGRPRLIVLDEPNANLDSEGEQALHEALIAAKAWGATLVVVAHQPGILRPVDKMLLLMNGQIRYFGPRDQLMGQLRSVQPRPDETARPALAATREVRS